MVPFHIPVQSIIGILRCHSASLLSHTIVPLLTHPPRRLRRWRPLRHGRPARGRAHLRRRRASASSSVSHAAIRGRGSPICDAESVSSTFVLNSTSFGIPLSHPPLSASRTCRNTPPAARVCCTCVHSCPPLAGCDLSWRVTPPVWTAYTSTRSPTTAGGRHGRHTLFAVAQRWRQ